MATTPKQVNGKPSNNNGSLGKRKKSRGSRGSYLSKWLDKTMHHIQESTPSMDTYDTYVNPNLHYAMGSSQFAPGYDPYRHMYGCGPEPMSLPTLPSYCNPPMMPFYGPEYRYVQNVNKSIQVQRPRLRRRSDNKAEEVNNASRQGTPTHSHAMNYLQPKNLTDSQDFASLPPIVTSVGDTNSNSEINMNEKDEGNNARRFSDPCVRGLPDVARPANGDVDSGSEASSDMSGSQVGSRLLTCLLDQISSLKMANERLSKDLMDTKVELENLRQHNAILKGSSSSMGATPNHSLNDNAYLAGQYAPGFLTDLVREIRDAARMREDALYSRVRAMVVERNDNGLTSSEAKFTEKALEEIKSSLRASEADKRRMMDRIVKLEDELRVLRVTNGFESNENKISNGNVEDADAERMRLRKELADMRKAKQNAEDHSLKLERLVTQLRSKFNGLQLTNGPESLPSDAEHDTNVRARRTSVNSANNSTVVFGPVTDL
ncbi:uncharacterized protein LOC111350327 isoform X1 [Spodoptera litura]|uniref:Uncharacterized protein LOC111350327 isoform X1 n=2 Tax=Spodoptera litura TaxID=69820 RepID=A0A9J7IK40_SPOLT|nr:uncharacterized protein LOC111350327 isoform X1 [Spodoptera litura]